MIKTEEEVAKSEAPQPPARPSPSPSPSLTSSPSPLHPSSLIPKNISAPDLPKTFPPTPPAAPYASSANPPPPSMFKLKRKPQPNKYTLAQQQQQTKGTSYSSVITELSNAVSGKGVKLKHVNTEEEMEKRRKEAGHKNRHSILREIEQVGNLRETNKSKLGKAKTLVDQTVMPAMQIWRKDLRKWNEELQSHFDHASKTLVLMFKLVEMREDEMSFLEAEKIVASSLGTDRLAEFLLRTGFSLKKNKYQEHTKEGKEAFSEEYLTIIRPANLPLRYLLRSILLALPGAKM